MPHRRRPSSPHNTPPLSPDTPTSSHNSLPSTSPSESSSALSTPFENLDIRDNTSRRSPNSLRVQKPTLEAQPEDIHSRHAISESDAEMFEHVYQESDRIQGRRSKPSSPGPSLRPHALPHFSHSHSYLRTRSPAATGERPALPHCASSFSKRHASFDSPREVPLPCMPSRTHKVPSSVASPASKPLSGTENEPHDFPMLQSDTAYPYAPPPPHSSDVRRGQDESIARMSDPMSPYRSVAATSYRDSSVPSTPDRDDGRRLIQSGRTLSGPASPSGLPLQYISPPTGRDLPRQDSSSSSSSAYSQAVLRPTPPDRSSTRSLPLPMHTPYHTLPTLQQAESGADPMTMAIDMALDQPSTTSPPMTSPRIAQTRADMGPNAELELRMQDVSMNSPSIAPSAPYLPARSTTAASPPPPDGPTKSAQGPPPATLRNNSVSLSSPASSLALSSISSAPAMSTAASHTVPGTPLPTSLSSASISSSTVSGSSTASSSASTSTAALRPPEPPTILTPPLPRAAHAPFLSQAPPPQDSYLAVETSPREYQLVARLPGFRRDSITLSTRRRRVLHVVADSWEPNGGHFERRISFGYDADLTQVRAEFDGEHLRITVPRRLSQVSYWEPGV